MSPPVLDPIRGALLRSQPDSRLVALVREGREHAFEEIVRRYRAPLTGFAAMFVPAHAADDVVQESLLAAYNALADSDNEIVLRPWLFRIVRNRALNQLRDTPVHEQLTEELDGVAQAPEVAERNAQLAALVGGLKALPEAQREAIVARELEGRGHAEIAAELGTSPGAVRQLIFRARGALRGAAGVLVPLPILRALLGPGGSEAGAAAATAGAGIGAATAGGGAAAGLATKVAAGIAGVAIAVGGGFAVERANRDRDHGQDDGSAQQSGSGGEALAASGAGTRSGDRAGADHSGPGGTSGDSGGDGGSPGGTPGHDDSSGGGPGHDDSGGHSGSGGDDGSSGHGDGDDEFDEHDSSGSVSGGSGISGSSGTGSGSSSGSSGSGSSGSGSSGSGSSGSSGSGSSGSSGSGSSGSSGSGEFDASVVPEPVDPPEIDDDSGSGSSGPG